MNKIFIFFLILSLSIIIFGCSFDKKTGIWNNKKKREIVNAKLIKLSHKQNELQSEINPELIINFDSKIEKNDKWTMSGLNNSNLSYHLRFDGQTNKFSKYKFEKIQNNSIKENPLIIGKNYFITVDAKGTIIKFSNSKRLVWNKNIYKKKEKKKINKVSLALFEDKIYAIDNLGKYYALNVDTGKIIWINNHKVSFNSQIKVYENKIFAIDNDNIINCFSTIDGKKIWEFKTNPTFIKTNKKLSIAVTLDSVLFSNTAGDIAKLNLNTGELIWFMPTQNTLLRHETNFLETSDLVLSKKNLFFSNNFSNLFSLNSSSGIINWILNVSSNLRPIIIDNYLFTISQEGYLVVIDSTKGEIIRANYIFDKFKLKEKKKLFAQGFLVASNKAYITTNLGYLIICSIKTGKVERVSKIGNFQLSEPFISNNKLYILSNKSVLVFN